MAPPGWVGLWTRQAYHQKFTPLGMFRRGIFLIIAIALMVQLLLLSSNWLTTSQEVPNAISLFKAGHRTAVSATSCNTQQQQYPQKQQRQQQEPQQQKLYPPEQRREQK
jgi:hypothetical protein